MSTLSLAPSRKLCRDEAVRSAPDTGMVVSWAKTEAAGVNRWGAVLGAGIGAI
jgi:hypothetical protein